MQQVGGVLTRDNVNPDDSPAADKAREEMKGMLAEMGQTEELSGYFLKSTDDALNSQRERSFRVVFIRGISLHGRKGRHVFFIPASF